MKKKTLQQIADEQGVSKQAIWLRTKKGRKYQIKYEKAYYKTPKRKKYLKAYHQTPKWKAYQKAYYKRMKK